MNGGSSDDELHMGSDDHDEKSMDEGNDADDSSKQVANFFE
jgi:hypothetical protein